MNNRMKERVTSLRPVEPNNEMNTLFILLRLVYI